MSTFQTTNALLSKLSPDAQSRLQPLARPLITFGMGQLLYSPGDTFHTIYFPEKGTLASIIAHNENGDSVEVGIAGYNGCVGVEALLGREKSFFEVIIQVPRDGLAIPSAAIQAEFDRDPDTRNIFLKYASLVHVFAAQSCLCNRLHALHARLCRWLLTSADHVGSEINTTQEFLGKMLGASRATVNLAAGHLQKQGMIKYSRGKVTILHPEQLKECACECYHTLRSEHLAITGN